MKSAAGQSFKNTSGEIKGGPAVLVITYQGPPL